MSKLLKSIEKYNGKIILKTTCSEKNSNSSNRTSLFRTSNLCNFIFLLVLKWNFLKQQILSDFLVRRKINIGIE